MKNISPQTKSFLILFGIALIGTYVCVKLANKPSSGQNQNYSIINYPPKQSANPVVNEPDQVEQVVDTSNWKTYTNSQYNLRFKIDPTWKVKQASDNFGNNMLAVDLGSKQDAFKVYVSNNDLFAVGQLPSMKEVIAGAPTINFKDLMYGIQHSNQFYTFMIATDLSLKPEFDAMVHSVSFPK